MAVAATLMGLWLAWGLTAGPSDPTDPATLVGRLGSTRFSERELASRELIDCGRDALLPLSKARKSADPEVQVRAEALLEQIEKSLLLRGSQVELPQTDLLMADALRLLGEQTGFRFEIDPGPDPAWLQQKVRIPSPAPGEFWPALRELGLWGAWVVDTQSPIFGMRAEPAFHISHRPANAPSDRAISGPFCLVYRSAELAPPVRKGLRKVAGGFPQDPAPAGATPCILHFDLLAEPRLSIRNISSIRVLEAIGPTGESLVLEEPGVFLDGPPTTFSVPGGTSTRWPFTVGIRNLSHGDPLLRQLSVEVDVTLQARRFEPFELPRTAGDEIVFATPAQLGDLEILEARIVRLPDKKQDALAIAAILPGWANMPAVRVNGVRRIDRISFDLERVFSNLEVVDAAGRPYRFDSNRILKIDEGFQATIGLKSDPDIGPPAVLRYYGHVQGSARFRFDFQDLSLATGP